MLKFIGMASAWKCNALLFSSILPFLAFFCECEHASSHFYVL